MSVIFNKIINFVEENPVEYITAASIIYKIIEEILMIQKDELFELLKDIIN